MRDNSPLLDKLLQERRIRIRRGEILSSAPDPLPEGFDFERIEGMMLGLAIGDALGDTTEAQLPSRRRKSHGEIRDYLPNRYASNRRVGLPSDDTQLAFWTLEQMLADDGVVPEKIADCFCNRRIFGIGHTVRGFIANRKAGRPWYECGVESAGNGALMRIAPILIPHLPCPSKRLWADAALAAMITHNDAGSIAACIAFVSMLWKLLGMERAPEADWWPSSFVQVARELEGDVRYRPRGAELEPYGGPIWRYVEQHLVGGNAPRATVVDACRQWYSGAYLLETVPTVLYILMRHGHDPEEAIIRSVNDTKDNDTIAAIVGACVGALHGRSALPARWIDNLLGRTTGDDDGRVFELLEAAKQRWGSSSRPANGSAE